MLKQSFQILFYEESEINKELFSKIKETLLQILNYDETKPDYVFIIGGDGTFLHFANNFLQKNTRIIGINTGTLGFYCELNKECMNYTIQQWERILHSNKFFQPLVLDTCYYDQNKALLNETYALNDFVITSPYTLKTDMFLNKNNKFLEYAGSGFILCTPTGSTGINKSNNGPIFFNSLNVYCLSFIMPVNNNKYLNFTNPFLFDKNQTFSFYIHNNDEMQIVNDGILIKHEHLAKTRYVEMKAVQSKCMIYLTYDCLETIQRMQRFF